EGNPNDSVPLELPGDTDTLAPDTALDADVNPDSGDVAGDTGDNDVPDTSSDVPDNEVAVDSDTATDLSDADTADSPDTTIPPRCGAYPSSCGGVSPAAVEHQMEAISDACAFGLRQTLDVAEERAIADELAAIAGGPTPL